MYMHILSYTFISSCTVILYFPIFSSCTFHILYFPMIFIYCAFHILYFQILYFHVLFIYCICHIHFVSLTLYFLYLYTCHHIAMLCFSYHVIYSIHFICIYLSFSFRFHVCKYLKSGYGKKLYVPESTITVRDSVYTRRYHHCTRQ